jgi:ATPase subunit of ABC transporter with duplicated ATPase domains
VQSRKKQIEKLALTDLKKSEHPAALHPAAGQEALGQADAHRRGPLEDLAAKTICKGFDALVTKGEKIAIVGRNGVGKTTLCKHARRRARARRW